MAEKTPVFMPLYFNLIESIEKYYPDSSLKELIMAMQGFYLNGEIPNIKDRDSQILFDMIKPQLEKSRKTYNSKVENGSKGGAPKGNQNAKKKEDSSKINLNQPKTTENNKDKEKEKEEDKGEEEEKEKEKDVDVEEGEDNYFSPPTTTTTTSFNTSTFLYDSFVVYWYKYPRKNESYYKDVYNVWNELNPDVYEVYDILNAIDNYYEELENKKKAVFARTFIELDEDDNRMYERFIHHSKEEELQEWLNNYNNHMGEPWQHEKWQPGYEKEYQQHLKDNEKANLLNDSFDAYESKLIEEFYKEYQQIIEANK